MPQHLSAFESALASQVQKKGKAPLEILATLQKKRQRKKETGPSKTAGLGGGLGWAGLGRVLGWVGGWLALRPASSKYFGAGHIQPATQTATQYLRKKSIIFFKEY